MPEALNVAVTTQARFEVSGVPYSPSGVNLPVCTVYRRLDSDGLETAVVTDQTTVNAGQSFWTYAFPALNNTAAGMLRYDYTTTDPTVDGYDDFGDGKAHLEAFVRVGNSWITNIGTLVTNVAAVPAAVWAYGTRTLTSFGTLVADIAAALSGFVINLVSPLTASGRLTIYAGADYYAVDGSSPIFTSTSTLDIASAVLTVGGLSFSCTVSGSSGAWTFTPTSIPRTSSTLLTVDEANYQLVATLTNGHIAPPLADGTAVIKRVN